MASDATEREARNGRIRQMREAGAPLAEIAFKEGVSVSTVQLALYGWKRGERAPVFYRADSPQSVTIEADSPEEMRVVFGLIRRALEKSGRKVEKAGR